MIKNILLALLLSSVLGFAADAADAAAPTQPTPGNQRGNGMMVMMDTNKDSKISKDEMLAWFVKVDTNKDGFISSEELKVAQDAFRAANGLGQGRGPGNRGQGRNAPPK